MAITDSNNTGLVMCQIEGCGTGIYVTASSNALSDATVAIACRFEGNGMAWEAANEFVRDMTVVYPAAFTPYAVVDKGAANPALGSGDSGHADACTLNCSHLQDPGGSNGSSTEGLSSPHSWSAIRPRAPGRR